LRRGLPSNARANGKLWFADEPSWTDVRQGDTGDCWIMAPLQQLSLRRPQVIRDMFIDNGDDTWTVRLFKYNGQADYVTVDRFFPVNEAGNYVFANRGKGTIEVNELWVPLAEKAYAQVNASGWLGRDGKNAYQSLDAGREVMLETVGSSPIPLTCGLMVQRDDTSSADWKSGFESRWVH
jgi:hypothetical protein